MKMDIVDLGGGLNEARLEGRLDIQGAMAIDKEFSELAGRSKNLLVDMSGVTFLASLGIRTLVQAAKTLSEGNGKLVLLAPAKSVENVLIATGIDTVIPIRHKRQEALVALGQ